MDLLLLFTMYFGAAVFPAMFFLLKGLKIIEGKYWKRFLLGLVLQVFWSLCVWVFVYYSWKQGHREYYWGWALLIPVNGIALFWYLWSLIDTPTSNNNLAEPVAGGDRPR